MKELKFKCPKCRKFTDVEVLMEDCKVSVNIDLIQDTGEIEYSYPEIHESTNTCYVCSECGWKLPVEPDAVDEGALVEWLSKKRYNK